ncbi:hypothetical protein FTUN_1777 [Frigoriglobus tundricola]|uniref:Uncharacterized protein n=1 Tax=Frigoriglobus tundricola TaxID=2774151 RepID=A0A6M5YJL7_9BACT|nr:hypothetical protein FTUN_1777 [Frigoriglobus tundricola]
MGVLLRRGARMRGRPGARKLYRADFPRQLDGVLFGWLERVARPWRDGLKAEGRRLVAPARGVSR